MPTVFDTLSETFYAAYFEPDTKKRRKSIDKWINSSVPVIRKAVKADLQSHIEQILETRWTPEGWQSGVKKFTNIMDNYRLVMNIQITDTKHMKYLRTVDPVTVDDRAKTLRRAEAVLSGFDKAETTKNSVVCKKVGIAEPSGNDDDTPGGGGGRSPNDQRSDVMNPNNPEYQAAADNRSNQMNPNNPAYHSSRGHGRR